MAGSSGTSAVDGLTSRGRATRLLIVTAAARLMFERGAAGTTLEDVRSAAGVSSSQLYHYFHDKDSLGSELAESDDGARAIAADGFRRWEHAIRRGFQAMQARGALHPGVDAEVLAPPPWRRCRAGCCWRSWSGRRRRSKPRST